MAIPASAAAQGERPFWPRRNWWLALLAILVLAGALRYPGYDWGLPFLDQDDEIFFALPARMIIDFGTAKSINFHHYPPGIIYVYYLVMRLFHDPATPAASVIWIVRLIAITMSLGVIALLGLFGYHGISGGAGLLGATFWAFTPLFVEQSRWGTAEIFVMFFSVLALYCTFISMHYRRESWATYATYALMLAIVFKYHCAFLTPVVLFAPLWNRRVSTKRVWANTGRFALFSAWFLLLTPVLDAYFVSGATHTNPDWVRHVQLRHFPNPLDLYHNLRLAFAHFDWAILLPGWLGLAVIPLDRGPSRGRALHVLSFLGVALFLWLAGISLFGAQGDHVIRFLFAWVSLSVILSGWGYATLLHMLDRWLARHSPQRRKFAIGVAGALLLVIHIPNLQEALDQTQQATLPDRRNELATWADRTLPAGKYIAEFHNRKTLNREWGGYGGETRFKNEGSPFADTTIEEWRAQGVLFAIVPHFQYQLWREEGSDEFVTETTLLKSYPRADAYRDPGMVVLLLRPIPHEATGQLGPIRLIAYELAEGSAQPGDVLPFHLYWQATAATEADYQVFNHLLDSEGNLVAQVDGPPLPDPLLRRGTSDWDDPEEIIYSREYALALSEDLAPGEYALVTGFYRRDTGQRLFSPTGEDALWVARIVVE